MTTEVVSLILHAMRAGRLHLQGGQLVGTPSLHTHNLAWRTEVSPVLSLGPWCPEGCCERQGHDLLSGSLIFIPPFTAKFQCAEYLDPQLHGYDLGTPSQPYPHFGSQVCCQEGPTCCLLRKQETKHLQPHWPLWQREAHQELHKLALNVARALVCAMLQYCRH